MDEATRGQVGNPGVEAHGVVIWSAHLLRSRVSMRSGDGTSATGDRASNSGSNPRPCSRCGSSARNSPVSSSRSTSASISCSVVSGSARRSCHARSAAQLEDLQHVARGRRSRRARAAKQRAHHERPAEVEVAAVVGVRDEAQRDREARPSSTVQRVEVEHRAPLREADAVEAVVEVVGVGPVDRAAVLHPLGDDERRCPGTARRARRAGRSARSRRSSSASPRRSSPPSSRPSRLRRRSRP